MSLETRHASFQPTLRLVQDHRRVLHTPTTLTSSQRNHGCFSSGAIKHPKHVRSVLIAAAAAEPSDTEEVKVVEEKKEWIALVANAEFMLNDVQNESLAEQLREKIRLYEERNKEVDFFIVPEPVWLDSRFPEKAKLVGRPCVALVSSDSVWMRFMKTRLDQVLEVKMGKIAKSEALESGGDLPEFKQPDIWRAPYVPYSPGWWKAFYPPKE